METRKVILRGKFGLILLICATLLMSACANPALEHLEQDNTYADQGQWDEAIIEYGEAIELDPDLALAYNNRGLAYAGKGEAAKAVSDLERCVELSTDPGLVQAAQQILKGVRK